MMNTESDVPRPSGAADGAADGAAREAAGAALLATLQRVFPGRELSLREAVRLQAWLREHGEAEFAHLGFLQEALHAVLAASEIHETDLFDLYLALERLVPVTSRGFEAAELALAARAPGRDWRDEPMTPQQGSFVQRFRGSLSPNATKGEAAKMVERLLREQPLSPRLERLRRFWNQTLPAGTGPVEFLEWLLGFHATDPDRQRAWRLFAVETDDNLRHADPARVPLGAGTDYLARIKRGGEAARPRDGTSRLAGKVRRSPMPTEPETAPAVAARPARRGTSRAVAGIAIVLVVAAGAGGALWWRGQPARSAAPPVAADSRDPSARTVAELKLVGIMAGDEPKAVIDGRLYRIGDLVDSASGLRIAWIDPQKNTVSFVDAKGRVIARSP